MSAARARRSVLYMPGANARALEKARTLPADALILDLEDAVAPDAKPAARDAVCAAVAERGYGAREVVIRVNGLDTPWYREDLTAAAAAGPDAVLVPKVGAATDVTRVESDLAAAGAADTVALWAMLETPAAMFAAAEIAAASPQLAVLVLGTNDLAKELRAEFVAGRLPLLAGLQLCLLGARAAGKVIIDGVYNDVTDLVGFEAECVQGRQFGFDGKTLIHPGQLEACNRVFAPDEAAIADAREVLAAWEQAQAEGKGVATVNGRMIENLHVANATRVIELAEAIAAAP